MGLGGGEATPGFQQPLLDNWFSPVLERGFGGRRQPDSPLSQVGLDPGRGEVHRVALG